MANKLKNNKSKSPDPEKLTSDKTEKVKVKELVKDERTHKIMGSILLLTAFFLFIAFTSYIFTWRQDQDKVFQGFSAFLFGDDIKAANLLGRIGAYISHIFFYKGFGLSSYLFCIFFFIMGVNLLFGERIFSPWRNFRYIVVGLIFFSTALAFITQGNGFPWGGETGNITSNWLSGLLGKIGTAALLLVGGFSYFIWRFNPSFSLPAKKQKYKGQNGNSKLVPVDNSFTEEAKLFTEENIIKDPQGNTLKHHGGVVVINPPGIDESGEKIVLSETSHEPQTTIIPKSRKKTAEELELQINALKIAEEPDDTDPADEEETPVKKVQNLPPYDPVLDLKDYKYPSLDLLETHGSEKIVLDASELEANKHQIINTLKNYDIDIRQISATVGPTVTLYEIVPAAGVRISRIKNLEDDIALSLAALGIRIIAPIPGKGTIGIEVPNVKKSIVSMKGLLSSEKFQQNKFSLPIALGKKIDNEHFIVDLATMPHLLMAGATGQGKSVGINAILVSLLYKKHPSQLKLVMVDPKKVELSLYRVIEKHFLAKLPGEEESIITDTKKVVHSLNALCIEMDNRYDLLKEAGCRNIREYNEKFVARRLNPEKGHQFLPFIVLVIDEFADLIMTAGKEIEMPIARLAQLARAVGIHLIIATQRPSVNIITGTIKANFPARVAFKVSSKIDSRTILDTGGAEQLIGRGDMLVSYNGEVTRVQCAFVDTPEVEKVVEFIGEQRGYPQPFYLPEYIDEKELEGKDFDSGNRDPLFEEAARLIVQSQIGSTSLLQRRMKLGYNRAGRLMDQLESAGIVGPNQGSKARDVIYKTEMELEEFLQGL
ncbi:FtsK/SpoIIIE family DNA translocase [Agriterribacter humi]|jgi:S-DNA-T family DNA segregation ATPase FtsK/SpoIIIE|uniref:FtsK/SpoIIIE family DNA translocase n=1 Tax=Agriterribacter humi TaxID=1104781 RepID=UPI001263F2DD|nr:DNA translocase FtsK [Agriterribacter humi]